jgi:hypothetical protein
MADIRFNENVEFFKNLAENISAARKSERKNSQVIKESKELITDCTVDEVK